MSKPYFAKKFGITKEDLEAVENGDVSDILEAFAKIGRPFGFKISYVRQDP